MKSAEKVAEDLGVSPLDIEKRLNPEFTRRFGEHIEERDGSVYFDAEVEEFLRLLFNKNGSPHDSRAKVYDIQDENTDVISAIEEAALANSDMHLPIVHWTQLPVVQSISMPLNYRPDLLVQAVEIQRRELNEFLIQFDRLVDQMVPSEELGGVQRIGGRRSGLRKPIRLAGTTVN